MLSHLTTEIYMQDNQTLQEHGFGENRMTSAHADKNWALNYENLQINCKSTTKLVKNSKNSKSHKVLLF